MRALRALFDGEAWPGGAHVPALAGPLLPPGSPAAVGRWAVGCRPGGRRAGRGCVERVGPRRRRLRDEGRATPRARERPRPSRRRGPASLSWGRTRRTSNDCLTDRADEGPLGRRRLDGHGRRAPLLRRCARRCRRDVVRRAAGRADRPLGRHRRGADRVTTSADLKRAKRAVRVRILAARDAMSASRTGPGDRAHRGSCVVAAGGRSCVHRDGVLVVRIRAGHAPLMEALDARGVRVALPRIVGGTWRRACTRPGDRRHRDVVRGERAVRRDALDPSAIDVVVTPAVAFDRSGRRVGYGGGFYDRFFPRTRTDTLRIGIGFDLQLVEEELPGGSLRSRCRRDRHRVGRWFGVRRLA